MAFGTELRLTLCEQVLFVSGVGFMALTARLLFGGAVSGIFHDIADFFLVTVFADLIEGTAQGQTRCGRDVAGVTVALCEGGVLVFHDQTRAIAGMGIMASGTGGLFGIKTAMLCGELRGDRVAAQTEGAFLFVQQVVRGR